MKVPLRWLQEFIDLPTTDPDELSLTFDMIGHKVESYEVLEAGWSGVVVGRVEAITAHPDADKVRVCQVDVGSGPEQIICGAWNFEEGAHVAVAKPGAVLPGDFRIDKRTIRGVESNGMICSEKELGLGEDHAGILVLDGEPEIGRDFSEVVELPDVVFDLEITTNRPDAMSMVGLARDLAAYHGIEYHVPPRPLTTVPGAPSIKVEIADPVGCRRFTAREIRGITVARSPLWVRHRLVKSGIRAISNVVDVTNYVMLELGHPLHAFDADTIAGGRLIVRRAAEGEKLVTLDDEERDLDPQDLIIYDEDGPTSMSGTMGGARSEVSPGTVNVLMEAASWDPPTIMYMSRRHGLRSEAATRFERGVDPLLTDEANARAAAMVAELAGGEVLEGVIDEIGTPVGPLTITLEPADVERLLGPGFTSEEVGGILTRLGMSVQGSTTLQVTVPTYRPDITRPADLVEEVARIHGYDRFGATLPTGPAGGLTAEQSRLRLVHRSLVGAGLSQATTLPFVNVDELAALGFEETTLLRVVNPLREEEATLRPSLLPGLLAAARFNVSRGTDAVALFETARAFRAVPAEDDPRLPEQVDRLALVIVGEFGPRVLGEEPHRSDASVSLGLMRHLMGALGHQEYQFVPAEVPGHHPGRTARVELNGVPIGHAGELSPKVSRDLDLPGRVAVAEVDLAPLLRDVERVVARAPSVYPPADFDLSFLVPDEVAVGALVASTVGAGGGLVESSRVFDVFRGPGVPEGSRAVAVTYRLRAPDHTLSNDETQQVRQAMIAAAGALGARLRGA